MDNYTSLKLKVRPEIVSGKEKLSTPILNEKNGIVVEEKGNIIFEINRQRYGAFIIDIFPWGLLIYLIAVIFGINLDDMSGNSDWINLFICLVPFLIYFALLPYFYSYTLGGWICKNKIVDSRTLLKPSLGQLILRSLMFLTVGTGIGFIIYLFTGYYWDKISKITVIKIK